MPGSSGRATLTVAIGEAVLGSHHDDHPTVATDYFAPAQFEDLDDAAKLSQPSFERMDAGASFGIDDVTAGPGQIKELAYETIRADVDPSAPRFSYIPALGMVLGQVACAALAKAPATTGGLRKFGAARAAAPLTGVRGDGEYVVAGVDTLARRSDVLPRSAAFGAVASRLQTFLAANPSERRTLQVAPLHEAA